MLNHRCSVSPYLRHFPLTLGLIISLTLFSSVAPAHATLPSITDPPPSEAPVFSNIPLSLASNTASKKNTQTAKPEHTQQNEPLNDIFLSQNDETEKPQATQPQQNSESTDPFSSGTVPILSSDIPTRATSHAPIGVMGDHVHKKGEWMLSYRYSHMTMKGNRNESNELSSLDVLDDFMVSPKNMKMDMHMVGLMYAPTNWLTTMVMVPYTFKSMDHVTRMGATFRTRSEGFGDIKLNGLVPLLKKKHHTIILNNGISFPTGSIHQRDSTPMRRNQRLPYPMQIGSGTYDLLPGITYSGQSKHWGWGVQAGSTIRLGKNDNDYRLGHRVFVTPWLSRSWNKWFSTSLRAKGRAWGNVSGADPKLNPRVVPTANPKRRKGRDIDLALGFNFFVPKGIFKNQRLAVEVGTPIYQDFRGPQLERDLFLTVGWQWSH